MIILGKNYELKYSLRAMFIFEQITDKAFQIKTLFDEYVLLYCCILAGSEEPLDFNDFISYCEEHPEILEEFSIYLKKQSGVDELLTEKDDVKKKEIN